MEPSRQPKTAIITGGNTGLGKETARQLAKAGLRIILACRNTEKAEAARQEIIQDTNNDNIITSQLDLASLKSVEDFAKGINESEQRIDILVNNAAVMSSDRQETVDGFELMFGVNHLGHFYLTHLLLDKLKASAPSRVVVLSSDGHGMGEVNFDDLQSTRGYSTLKDYGRSKTCNILFSVHLAKLLAGTGVTTYALHPGVVRTELTRDQENSFQFRAFRRIWRHQNLEEGAKTTVFCCLDPSLDDESGLYYKNCKKKAAKSYATDPNKAERLWRMSMELCGISKTPSKL